jgi:imidazolonepropionase-like amidohydrolase
MKLKFLTAFLACTMATPALADVLIDNVEGLTIDEDGEVKRFTGLVIGDDGKIVQLLERGDDKPQTDYREDGQGRVMIPGLIDAHSVVGLAGYFNHEHDQDQLKRSSPIQPELRAIDSYNTREPLIITMP